MLLKKTNLYKESQHRLTEIESVIAKKEERLKKAPQGSMRYIVRNGNVQYYLRRDSKDKSGEYVRKGQKEIIKKYLQKSYDEKILKLLVQEAKALEQFCEKTKDMEQAYGMLYSKMPNEVKNHIAALDMDDQEYAKKWENVEYERKPISEEMKERKTDKGEFVRSKSELTIANALFRKNIPYRYECPLKLKNGRVIHPDFTVLNVRTRKVYYWEHRGMMDDREYAKGAVERQKDYIKSGIMLGDSLVVTEETLNRTLSTAEIDAVINTYFL